jgi:hypothetical protein
MAFFSLPLINKEKNNGKNDSSQDEGQNYNSNDIIIMFGLQI